MTYVKGLRELVGHAPLELTGTGIFVYQRIGSKIDFLLQHRTDNDRFGLLGGGLELGESYYECASRELFEEANILANENDFKLVGAYAGSRHFTIHPNGDIVYHSVIVFSIDYDKCVDLGDPTKYGLAPETKELRWVSVEEIEELLEKNRIFPNNAPILEDLIGGKFVL